MSRELVYVEINQDYCSLTYGVAPCTAATTWVFENNNNSFTAANASLTASENFSIFAPSATDPRLQSPSSLGIDGSRDTYVFIDIMKTVEPSGTHDGKLYYATAGHSFSGSYYANIPDPPLNVRTTLKINMADLAAGGDDWITSTISQIRIDLTNVGSGSYNIYSISVSRAAPCYNTRKTCQDLPNFTNEPVTLRFGLDVDYLPQGIECIPSITNWTVSPAVISLGEDLGLRAEMRVTFKDHPWSDTGPGGDKNLTKRFYDPFSLGTFWGKWRARVQYLRGQSIRLIVGSEGQSLAEMETRNFVIDSFDGPTPDGMFTIIGKDPLKLLDGDRAQAPMPSNGFLVADINSTDTAFILAPSGVGDAEYPASGYINIGGAEIVQFTRSGDNVTIVARGQLGTTAQDHQAQDRAQVVLRYDGDDPADIIYDLMVNYAGLDASYINLSDWQIETENFLRRVYSATIGDPESVKKLIVELVQQATLSIWWDDIGQKIRLRVLRAIETDAELIGPDIIQRNSFRSMEQPDKRVSQVWIYYGQRNPLQRLEDLDNFRSLAVSADLDAETNYGSPMIRKIYSRWIASGGRTVATRIGDIILGRYKDPPRRFNFAMLRGVRELMAGQGYRTTWWTIQDATGATTNAPIQITRVNPASGQFAYEAEEQLFQILDPEDLDNRTLIFDAAILDVDLRAIHDSLYPEPEVSDTFTLRVYVETNVVVGASTTGNAAMDIGTWPAGVVIEVYNNGRIQGAGGKGGNAALNGVAAEAGSPGRLALYTRKAITLDNLSGKIYGGGGGGGGGAIKESGKNAGGGGGGAGYAGGAGGNAGNKGDSEGAPGTLDAGGLGGIATTSAAWSGGNGGGPAEAGLKPGGGGAGGGPGGAIDGNSYITFTALGDIKGTRIN